MRCVSPDDFSRRWRRNGGLGPPDVFVAAPDTKVRDGLIALKNPAIHRELPYWKNIVLKKWRQPVHFSVRATCGDHVVNLSKSGAYKRSTALKYVSARLAGIEFFFKNAVGLRGSDDDAISTVFIRG
jgi:hypothetical protein